MKSRQFLAVLPLVVLLCGRVHARPVPAMPLITVDEFGNGIGTVGGGYIQNDPLPGGRPNVLTYNLPFDGVQGDVFLRDGGPTGPINDVIRFTGEGTMLFYSDNVDGVDAPADTPRPPTDTLDNTVSIDEIGTDDANGAYYTPGPEDPGYDGEFTPTYHFVSDGVVPEPGSMALLATGGLPLLGVLRRRKRA
jgi:hypothetical protein